MEYRYLGNSGLRVSTICLGTMNSGATPGDTTLSRAAKRFADNRNSSSSAQGAWLRH